MQVSTRLLATDALTIHLDERTTIPALPILVYVRDAHFRQAKDTRSDVERRVNEGRPS